MLFRSEYGISASNTRYSLDIFDNQKFITHSLNTFMNTTLFKKLEFQNDINYNYNPNVAPGFQKSVWFWNASLKYSVAKDRGTIGLKAFDLLNQNTNVRRVATQNYIEDFQSTVLQQYFLLSFSWKFNTLKKKKS